jgi:tetratricopeptide (TPR) repeat protein
VGLAVVGVVGVLLAVREWSVRDPGSLADEARRAVATREWSRAESLLDRLSRLRPRDPADMLLRADFERGRGRPDAALDALARISDGDPLAPKARLMAGQIERERGRLRRAESALLAALRLDPKRIQARRELIYLYGMQGRRPDMSAQFRALSELVPLDHRDMLLFTLNYEDIWRNSSVRADLERFLAADPEDRWSRLALAEVLQRSGLLDESEAVLRPLPDSDVEARALRARLALDRSRLEEARALLAGGPAEHAGLARLRGRLAMRSGDPSGAAEQFRIAVALEPTDLESVQGLALALKLAGDADGAESAGRRAERLRALARLLEQSRTAGGNEARDLAGQLGAACEAVGLVDEARGWYRLAISLDPLDSEAQQALFRLRDTPG